ncbi:hypothetical protein LTR56_025369 [Elasticomyces elasticus]|nr:hypothetical protein LTR56_025369 [Elasticomyces elasticus]KAK3620936.1 hypothetical protein LTR22_025414 [Elasticomyces elasticus]KAK4917574.1 hypothetical protein LTR49_014528 [Elasticomyces elasticus]KAK5762794.1 hypothetical protein LTS12_006983 [Elasticomyces elasticus]
MTRSKRKGSSSATIAMDEIPKQAGVSEPINRQPQDKSSQPMSGTGLKRAAQVDLSNAPKKRTKLGPAQRIRSHGHAAWNELLQHRKGVAPKTVIEKAETTARAMLRGPSPSQITYSRGRAAWNELWNQLLEGKGEPTRKRRAIRRHALLSLPAELRNEIYEYVLLEPDIKYGVLVTPDLELPPLLSVCRQVRSESRGIWYNGQKFTHVMSDCNADTMLAWSRHLANIGIPNPNHWKYQFEFDGEPNWDNLMRWCKTLCEDGGLRMDPKTFLSPFQSVIGSACQIARESFDCERSWKECRGLLEILRRTVGKFEKKWLA